MSEVDIVKVVDQKAAADPERILGSIRDYLNSIGEPEKARRAVCLLGLESGAAGYAITLSNFKFGDANPVFAPTLVVTREFVNDSSAQITDTFTYSKSLQESQSFSFTEGLKVGTKATAKVGLPLVGKSSVEVNAEVSFGASQSFVTNTTQSWSQSSAIQVPPHTTVKATGFVRVATNTARSFSGEAVVSGGTLFYFLSAVTDPETKYMPPNAWYLELPISAVLDPSDLTFPLAGSWSGSLGVSVVINAEGGTTAG